VGICDADADADADGGGDGDGDGDGGDDEDEDEYEVSKRVAGLGDEWMCKGQVGGQCDAMRCSQSTRMDKCRLCGMPSKSKVHLLARKVHPGRECWTSDPFSAVLVFWCSIGTETTLWPMPHAALRVVKRGVGLVLSMTTDLVDPTICHVSIATSLDDRCAVRGSLCLA